jgi:hypothetical protein
MPFDRRWMLLVIQIYFIAVSAQRVWRTARRCWRPHRLGRVPLVLPTFTFAVAGQGRPCCRYARPHTAIFLISVVKLWRPYEGAKPEFSVSRATGGVIQCLRA